MGGGSVLEREPCPDRIVDDLGDAFTMGAVGGSAFHFIKGLRNSPHGARIAGGMEAVCMNVPRVGGRFAIWGGLFSACDCALMYVRQKEDPYNSILAGAATSGILSLRQGFRSVVGHSLLGALILALVTDSDLMLKHPAVPKTGSTPDDDPFIPHVEISSAGGWFGGLFGKKVEEGAANSSSKTETLETYDVPSMHIPSFEFK